MPRSPLPPPLKLFTIPPTSSVDALGCAADVSLYRPKVEDSIDLNGLIKLFVNHRPVVPVSKKVILEPKLR